MGCSFCLCPYDAFFMPCHATLTPLPCNYLGVFPTPLLCDPLPCHATLTPLPCNCLGVFPTPTLPIPLPCGCLGMFLLSPALPGDCINSFALLYQPDLSATFHQPHFNDPCYLGSARLEIPWDLAKYVERH